MRNSFCSFLCRPVSIINLWFESLNFDICILIFGFLISDKYFSNPILFLKVAYVLNYFLRLECTPTHFDEMHQRGFGRFVCLQNKVYLRMDL